MSPALAGRFLTTGLPGKSRIQSLFEKINWHVNEWISYVIRGLGAGGFTRKNVDSGPATFFLNMSEVAKEHVFPFHLNSPWAHANLVWIAIKLVTTSWS